MTGRVDKKIALVTGAGSGLGKATALLLAREGASIMVTDLDAETASETAAEIETRRPGAAMALGHDVTSEEDWRAVMEAAENQFGGLNILINNAGVSIGGNIEGTDFATFRHLQDVDLNSVFLGCQKAMPLLRAAGGGSIVNISSTVGIMGNPHTVSYGTAKAGVRHLTKSVALHCARKGYEIRCNSVHPTFVRTPLLDRFTEAFGDKEKALAGLAKTIPMGRIAEPDDVTYGILYLASDESKMVTGTELVIDGGLCAGYIPPA
jgi:NAD(P)-dependent dehydrogenase (short-subunit alcohol dehydrogenase family)